jgi:membrane-associated phospholipid phosphatase
LLEYGLVASPVREARVYALQSIAFYDAAIGCWDAKYTYWAPRPFMVDKDFKSLFTTPNHPSYPSAHSCVSTSVAATLGYLFPQDATTFKTYADQAGESRLWAGIHFRSDVVAGAALGNNVSQKIIERSKGDGSQ